MIPGFRGPNEQWQAELEKVSKLGLIDLIEELVFVYGIPRENLLQKVRAARSTGRFLNALRQHDELRSDPARWFEKKLRQRASAKKAARRRKKEHRSK
jgi:hypothetical protein